MSVTSDVTRRGARAGNHPVRAAGAANDGMVSAALAYHGRGWSPTPVKYKGKRAKLPAWNKRRLTEDDIRRHLARQANIGIVLGEASGGLLDVDLDCPEAVALADALLPSTGSVFGRPGKLRSHRLYVCASPTGRTPYPRGKEMLVELRGNGTQSVFPPSVQESGEAITFDQDDAPAEVEVAMLADAVARLAVACVLMRRWPREPGVRQEIALAVAGGLMRAGVAMEDAVLMIGSVARAAGDEEADQREAAVESTYSTVAGNPTTGWPRLAELISVADIGLMHGWLKDPGNARIVTPRPRRRTHDTHDAQDAHDAQIPKDAQRYAGSSTPASPSPPPLRDGTVTARMKLAQADIEAKRAPSLPLAEHVAAALEWHWYWTIKGQPKGENWRTPTWGLTRFLRGHPDLATMNGGEALMALEQVFKSWPTPGGEHPTAYWTGLPKADAQAQIVFGWNAVKYAAGFGPLDAALARARETPLSLPPKDYGGEDYETFISTMGWLQVIAGDVDIYISCRAVGKLIGVSINTISLYRQTAVAQGYLIPGKLSSGHHEADEFSFVLEKLPALATEARNRSEKPAFFG